MADVKIFGHNVNPWAAGAIGVGSVIVIVFAWKQHEAASGSSAAASSSAIDPLTGLPTSEDNEVDPITGMTYLEEAQEYGSVQAAEAAYSAGETGQGGLDTGTGSGGGGNDGAAYTSNAQWAQAAEAGLTDIGYSSTDVAAALGRYLAKLSVTSAQATIIDAAIAEYGNPPVGSFQVILASPPGSGGSGGGDVQVPDVIGDDAAQASQTLTSVGFKVDAPKAVKGVTHQVTAQSPKGGAKAAMGSKVTLTTKTVGGTSPAAKATVPDVVGKSQADAYSVLSGDGFHPSGQAPVAGYTLTVTAQSPKAGAKADKGSTVTLTSTRKKG